MCGLLEFDEHESPRDALGITGTFHLRFQKQVAQQTVIPRTAMNEMFEVSRVPSGHGFPVTIKNPQPDGMRLAKLSP